MGKCASACVPGEEEDDPWLGRVGAAKNFYGYGQVIAILTPPEIGKVEQGS